MCPEQTRLDALRQLNLLDTPPSDSFDRITRMAAMVFGLPIAAISLTDRDRQWFKSRVGVEHSSIPRAQAPCAQVAESTQCVVISDLLADPDYVDSPLARDGVRFYAGVPLTTRSGCGLGALCVLGLEPRGASAPEIAALTDLADMVMSQIELQHAIGRVDPVSGLLNRNQLLEDLEDLGRNTPGQRRLLALVDLAPSEQLTQGMSVMGPTFIDQIVQAAASGLRAGLGPGRTAYHVAATQFAFLGLAETDDATFLARLKVALNDARLRGAHERFVLTSTIGVAPFLAGQTPGSDVLRMGYSAAQDARLAGGQISLYSSASDGKQVRRFSLLKDFCDAFDLPGELRLVYQPRIDLAGGGCCGAEALLRWTHPKLGDVSPTEFIPIVEQTALMRPVTTWVLDHALEQLAAWHASGIDLQLSINVSAANLEEVDFVERVQLYLLKHRVRPEFLELEVTESAMMCDPVIALARLRALADLGIRIALDDFGTGHSSLAYLQRLPISVVKIDRSFVQSLDHDAEQARILVRTMIQLSHGLGHRVVAEGVETADTAQILNGLGCDEAQGYHYARPLEQADFERWFRQRRSAMRAATACAA